MRRNDMPAQQAAFVDELKSRVRDNVDFLRPEITEVARWIHDHPEIKFEETRAVEAVSATLGRFGHLTETKTSGLETAFRCQHSFARPGKTVAFLAEYDALPGIGHACGHNLIAGSALAAFLAFQDLGAALEGAVVLLGTPGEEGGGGKVTMLERHAFDDLDAALMFHPAPFTSLNPATLAVARVAITFAGRAAHAGSPEDGVNALNGVIQTFNSVNAFRGHMRSDARVNGIICSGGEADNVIPERARAIFSIRAKDDDYLDSLIERVKRSAEGAAIAIGADATAVSLGRRKALTCDKALVRAFAGNLRCLGEPTRKGNPHLFSTDMGDVSQVVPSIHPMLAIADSDGALHSREFAMASATDRAFDVMITAAKALAMTAIDVLATGAEKVTGPVLADVQMSS